MALDLSKIENEPVGYEMLAGSLYSAEVKLKKVLFREFIPTFVKGIETSEELYGALEKKLSEAIQQTDSKVNPEEATTTEGLAAGTALYREQLLRSMRLIKENYL
jgi:hypothetical protein